MTEHALDETAPLETHAEHIVVGIDGSPHSRHALDWAVAHARPHDLVQLVHIWQQPIMAAEAGIAVDSSLLRNSAEATLDREVSLLRSRHDLLPRLEFRVIEGHAGASLIDAASGADLLVVGTRGHGGFAGLLLGSTSTYLVHHAACPLVIVPLGDGPR